MNNLYRNILVLSHTNVFSNRVFTDYCYGIEKNSDNFIYIDYIEEYRVKGKEAFEFYVFETIANQDVTHVVVIPLSGDLTLDPTFLLNVSQKSMLLFNLFDTEYFFDVIDRYYAQLADLVILPDKLSQYPYIQLGIPAHTSFALYDARYYKNDLPSDLSIDVSFVGDMQRGKRLEFVHYLLENGIKVAIYGAHSDRGIISFDEMVSVFSRSKINLNFTGMLDFKYFQIDLPRINQRIKQSKGRPIEIALCGGFVLTEYAPGIETMFEPEHEIGIFETKEELLQKIIFYLENDNIRCVMAERSHKRAIENYDCIKGFEYIFNTVLVNLPSKKYLQLFWDRNFRSHFASYHLFFVSYYLLQGDLNKVLTELLLILRQRSINLRAALSYLRSGLVEGLRMHKNIFRVLYIVKKTLLPTTIRN